MTSNRFVPLNFAGQFWRGILFREPVPRFVVQDQIQRRVENITHLFAVFQHEQRICDTDQLSPSANRNFAGTIRLAPGR